MTYNFDPERWYDNHLARLTKQHGAGELDDATFQAALKQLDKDYEGMLDRLDGTYQLPSDLPKP